MVVVAVLLVVVLALQIVHSARAALLQMVKVMLEE
jgi:hypothetical protein